MNEKTNDAMPSGPEGGPTNKRMFTVHLCAPILTWEGIEAETEQEAIGMCQVPQYFDDTDVGPTTYLVEETAPEDEEEDDEPGERES